jgi:hypothetical protein
MRLLLEIKDVQKAQSLLEVLKDLTYVKTTRILSEKEMTLNEIKSSIKELNKVKNGKLKARPIEDLINEL